MYEAGAPWAWPPDVSSSACSARRCRSFCDASTSGLLAGKSPRACALNMSSALSRAVSCPNRSKCGSRNWCGYNPYAGSPSMPMAEP